MSGLQMENVADAYPLTPMQEGMLFHAITEPGTGVFMGQFAATLSGPLDAGAFRSAWDTVIARHPALRTFFVWQGMDDPVQVVRETAVLPWTEHDWRDRPAARQGQDLGALMAADVARDFDLGEAPLMRMALVRLNEASWRWIWTAHHLISDGWSTGVILREVMAAYTSAVTGTPLELEPAPAYRAFVAHHTAHDRPAGEGFWREALAGFEAPTPIAPATPAPAGSEPGPAAPRHARVVRRVPANLLARTETFARSRRLTLSTVVQGAWSLVLARATGEADVVFGVTTSGRPPELEGVERAVGVFINTLPLRVTVDEDQSAGDWLAGVQRRHLAVRAREADALADVQRWSALPRGTGLFDSLVVFENYPGGLVVGAPEADLAMGEVTFLEQSNFPLAILFMPGDPARIIVVHDRTRVGADRAADLAARLLHTLEALVDGADRPLSEIESMPPEERERVLVTWNDTGATLDADRPITSDIVAAGRREPGHVAIVDPAGALRYGDFDDRSAAVAVSLLARGAGRETRIGLLTGATRDMAVGLHAIQRGGAAYVPLDPAYPAAYRRRIAERAGLALILAGDAEAEALRADASDAAIPILTIEEATAEGLTAAATGGAADLPGPAPDDLAYVIHTSGSTGLPKGVMVTHRTLAHATRARRVVYGGAPERFLLLSSMAFDSSVAGIFWTLAGGGTLVLPPARIEQDMRALAALIAREQVTHFLALPTLHGLLLEHADPASLTSLHTVIVAGEACDPGVVRRHHETIPSVRLFNEYGPTEGTVWCTARRLTPADASGAVPIGTPIPGARVRLLDGRGRLVPPGAPGELHLGGAGVARGYLGDEALTAERFIPWTDPHAPSGGPLREPERLYRTGDLARWRVDGTLEFAGRADGQVKVRGHRIEPDGVAAALRDLDGVGEAAAAARRLDGGPARLVAWVTPDPASGDRPEPAAVRAAMKAGWTASMVPDAVVVVDAMPRLPNGKIDVTSLPDPEAGLAEDRSAAIAPRTETERRLAAIWSEALGIETLGVEDDFFELGGDSLLSIRIMSRIEQAFGRALPLTALLDHGTVAAIAALLDPPGAGETAGSDGSGPDASVAPALGRTAAAGGGAAATPNGGPISESPPVDDPTLATLPPASAEAADLLVPFRRQGTGTPLFCVHAGGGHVLEYRHLAVRLGEGRPVHGLQPVGIHGDRPPLRRVEAMAERYVEAIRTVQPRGPYALAGHCSGAVICWEMARQIEAAGESVAFVAVIDAMPPRQSRRTTTLEKAFRYAIEHGPSTVPYILRRARVAWNQRILRQPQVRRQARDGTPEERRLAVIEAVSAASRQAVATYVGPRMDVPVLQIRSSDFASRRDKARHVRWDRYCTQLERHVVEADHRRILLEPSVTAVAALIAERLTALDEDRTR